MPGKSDDIKIVNAVPGTNQYDLADSKLTAKTIVADDCVADIDNERITVDGTDVYKFNDSTVIMNIAPTKVETISWNALTDSTVGNTTKLATEEDMIFFVKGTKVVYAVVDVANYGVSDKEYGIITAFGRDYDEEGDRIYTITILTADGEKTYECKPEVRDERAIGDLIAFNVSEGVLVAEDTDDADTLLNTPVVEVAYDIVEYLEDFVDEDVFGDDEGECDIASLFTGADALEDESLAFIKVDAVDADTIEFKYKDGATEKYRIVELDEDYVVFDLIAGEVAEEIGNGDYVLTLSTDGDAEAEIIVIVK